MSSYNEKLQEFFKLYRAAGNDGAASAKEVAGWAFEQGLWKPRTSDVIKILAEDLSRAWREEYRTDKKGRRYRVKHPVRKTENGAQIFLWDDMETAPREHMQMAFSQRRQQIVGDCVQLKVDVDVYNDKNPDAPAIQVPFDFTYDIEEELSSDDKAA